MSIWFNSKSQEGWLSNFSMHPVSVGGLTYGSVEHAYQAAKFSSGSEVFDRVCGAATPAEAKAAAQAAPALEHWLAIREHVMRAALSAKSSQHSELLERLLGTGNRPLVHESKDDLYWGRRRDSGDPYHTSRHLLECFATSFSVVGWSTAVNEPFAGTIVPSRMMRNELRVQSIMIEVNKRLYLRDVDKAVEDFARIAGTLRRCCVRAMRKAMSGGPR